MPQVVLVVNVPGRPAPWARAGARGKRHFTPAKVRNHQALIATLASDRMAGQGLYTGPLRLTCTFCYTMADSWPAWKRELGRQGRLAHTDTPDTDNLVKNVKDALNGVVWKDDRQVCEMRVIKRWGNRARTEITIEDLSDVKVASSTKKNPFGRGKGPPTTDQKGLGL